MNLLPVILAAGKGSRMCTSTPKVLHTLAGKPMLSHVIDAALSLSSHVVVVQGAAGEQVRAACDSPELVWVTQAEQLGTGHAVLQAEPVFSDDTRALILYGDVPLISPGTLKRFIAEVPEEHLGILTAVQSNPKGLGRICRDSEGKITGIVEEKDASETEKAIRETNSGIFVIPPHILSLLNSLDNKNEQQEYYLTDLVALAIQAGHQVSSLQVSPDEVKGVNTKSQLAMLERQYQRNCAELLMEKGVQFADPSRFDCRGQVTVGKDVFIDVGVIIEGDVILGDNCHIGPYTHLKNSRLSDSVTVHSHSIIESSRVESGCSVGPFARCRPGTHLSEGVKVGNFVETKNSILYSGAKANHLAYLGDCVVGAKANIGAGTITCNYDGVNKHKTEIGKQAFIGSNSCLVAPVTIGAGATVGAGSVITKDVHEETLALTRASQKSIKGWSLDTKISNEKQEK